MCQLDSLANAGKSDGVIADDIAAAKHRKANGAALASAGDAMT